MQIIHLAFLIAALVCFLLGVVGIGGRINLVALGLACWVFSLIVPA